MPQSDVPRLGSLSNFSNICLCEETTSRHQELFQIGSRIADRAISPSRPSFDDDDLRTATSPRGMSRPAKGLSPSLLSDRNCARAYTYLRSMARARFQKHVHAATAVRANSARSCIPHVRVNGRPRSPSCVGLPFPRPPVCLALSNLGPGRAAFTAALKITRAFVLPRRVV